MTSLQPDPKRSDPQLPEVEPEGHPDLPAGEARAGVTTGHVRWILTISLALATLALIAAGLWFSARSPNPQVTPPSAAARSA